MTRSIPEWIGTTDDTPIPPRVQLRVLLRFDGRCPKCTRKFDDRNKWDIDHIVPLCMAGPGDPTLNRESNLQPLCRSPCHSRKTKADVAEKAATYKARKTQMGIKRKVARPLPGTKASGWKHRMSGEWVRR